MTISESVSKFANAISSKIDQKISIHNEVTGSSSTKGHVKAGGAPQTIGTSSSAGTDNGYYARADHVHTCSYNNLTNKPSSFTPSSHTHSISNITNLQSTLNDKADEEHTHSHEDVSFTGLRETWQGLGSNKNIGQALDYLMYLFELNSFDINKVYPVGSIYISVNNTNPSTLFGGQWEQIKDKFLLAAGNTHVNGATGGEATHTLTENEMPKHNHSVPFRYLKNAATASSSNHTTNWSNHYDTNAYSGEKGGGQAHNNMPPYLVVNIWKRTA